MKKVATSIIVLAVMVSLLTISCNNQNKAKPLGVSVNITKEDKIKRGEYLVTIMGCDDCHTPKKMGPNGPELDMDNRLSGHPAKMPLGAIHPEELKSWVLFNPTTTAFVGPWGISYSANLTPHETGVGAWSEQQFIKAIREGKYKGMDNTRPLLPPMPWPSFSKASDEDLQAIFSYLKSLKPVDNLVPPAVGPDKLASLK